MLASTVLQRWHKTQKKQKSSIVFEDFQEFFSKKFFGGFGWSPEMKTGSVWFLVIYLQGQVVFSVSMTCQQSICNVLYPLIPEVMFFYVWEGRWFVKSISLLRRWV